MDVQWGVSIGKIPQGTEWGGVVKDPYVAPCRWGSMPREHWAPYAAGEAGKALITAEL